MVTSDELAERMKLGILEDVCAGVVPETIAGFPQLHEYVDANLYGGTEALLRELEMLGPQNDEGYHEALMKFCDLANPAIDTVDWWIKSGGLRDALARRRSQCRTSDAPSPPSWNDRRSALTGLRAWWRSRSIAVTFTISWRVKRT